MNERIKHLAEKANIRFGRMAILDGDPRGMARFVTYSEFEKFSELLIQECITQLHKRGIDGFGILEERNLKQHFGVKE